MIPSPQPLQPFGLRVDLAPGTRWDDLNPAEIRAWVDAHRVLVLRGLAALPPEALAVAARRLGPLQPWSFGAVHELKRDAHAENYLYTEHEVPLHWDGAFAGVVPHFLVFRCIAAPPPGAGGETVFVDTVAALRRVPEARRAAWRGARVRYTTEKKAHYGGTFTADVIARHPTLGVPVVRYAEPVHDLNPVSVEPLGHDGAGRAALLRELGEALHDPSVELALAWEDGDVVIADNYALLHGRRAFRADAPRHLLRVNVLDPERRSWWGLRDAWRLRRPEFMRAEIPILLIPALLSASRPADLARLAFVEGAALFFLLFQVGDMVNCLLDQEVDLHRKTHLAEAVRALGTANVKAQIVISAALAMGLGVHLALTLGRPWMAGAAVLGVLLGASYTAPPLRLKNRGLVQIGAYAALLFVGPMAMIAGIFVEVPGAGLLLAAIAYGTMQTGVLLVNNAEDLDEDEREGIRTAAVALQARGAVRLARALALVGGLGYAGVLAATTGAAWALAALLPLAAAVAYNERWLRALGQSTAGLAESAAREAIRKQGRFVPRHLEAGAWAACVAALAVLLARGRG
jgi:alpha-ketoglutarate-dependent taurine dioxygenase/1,4-dihydroxy-2-naphthoate octaprenyltransferase